MRLDPALREVDWLAWRRAPGPAECLSIWHANGASLQMARFMHAKGAALDSLTNSGHDLLHIAADRVRLCHTPMRPVCRQTMCIRSVDLWHALYRATSIW